MSDINSYEVVGSPNYSGPAATLASIFGFNKPQQPQQNQQQQSQGQNTRQPSLPLLSMLSQFLQGGGQQQGGSPMQLSGASMAQQPSSGVQWPAWTQGPY